MHGYFHEEATLCSQVGEGCLHSGSSRDSEDHWGPYRLEASDLACLPGQN